LTHLGKRASPAFCIKLKIPLSATDLLGVLAVCYEVGTGVVGLFDAIQLLLMPSVDVRDGPLPVPPPGGQGQLCAVTGFASTPAPLTSASGEPSVANFLMEAQFRSAWGIFAAWPARPVFVARMPLGESVWGLASAAPAVAPGGAPLAISVLPGALSREFFNRPDRLAAGLAPSASTMVPPADASWGSWLRSLALLSSDQGSLHQQLHLPLGALVTVVGAVRSVRLADGRFSVVLARDWRRGLLLLGAGDLAGLRAAALRACGVSLGQIALGCAMAALLLRARAPRRRHGGGGGGAPPQRLALPPHAPPDTPATDDNARCVVCWTNASCVALAPCGHVCLCAGCVPRLAEQQQGRETCPTCRNGVEGVMRVFT
jgi:hypothetical protein